MIVICIHFILHYYNSTFGHCTDDTVDVDTHLSSSLATAAATASSGQLFMMNLLIHSLMDDDAGLQLAVESLFKRQLQVLVSCCFQS